MSQHQKRSEKAEKSKDEERFLSLIESSHRLLLKVCWAYTNTSHDRDDLIQEIVSQLWAAFGTYDRNRAFTTWMYRVAINVAIDFRRRRERRRDTRSMDDTCEPMGSYDVTRHELLQELHELLERQSDLDRAILVMHLEGSTYREIAEVVGMSASNVGTRLSRLKLALRKGAESVEQGCEGEKS